MRDHVQVAFLGLGRMGAAMAQHVLDAHHDLQVWNRTPAKAAELVAAGAVAAGSPAEAARGADVVIAMLAHPDAVREVLLGPDGVADGAAQGTLVIDASTIGPQAAQEIGAELEKRGLRYLDAPVLGSIQPARDGTLAVFAGGSEADYADAEPLLRLWGDAAKVRRVGGVGGVGSASAVKLVINLTIGVATAGVGEALRLACDLGVDRHVALDALAAGPLGATVATKRTMLEEEEYSPRRLLPRPAGQGSRPGGRRGARRPAGDGGGAGGGRRGGHRRPRRRRLRRAGRLSRLRGPAQQLLRSPAGRDAVGQLLTGGARSRRTLKPSARRSPVLLTVHHRDALDRGGEIVTGLRPGSTT
jgi:3-hydroxyisobutyrate dehydrogenase